MPRNKPADRRKSYNLPITFLSSSGKEIKLQITIGYGPRNTILEVFCADFKAGSDNHALVMDACILLSRLLQHGDTPEELVKAMCTPPSLIGAICTAILKEQQHAHV